MWIHACGWQGEESDLQERFWNGILCNVECPKCNATWPFFNEPEYHDDYPTEAVTMIVDAKSRKIWEEEMA